MSQFAPGLCGCGFESRRCLQEESMVEGPNLLILRRLEPSKGRFKNYKRISIEEQMFLQATKVRKTMKKKKLEKKGKVKGKI